MLPYADAEIAPCYSSMCYVCGMSAIFPLVHCGVHPFPAGAAAKIPKMIPIREHHAPSLASVIRRPRSAAAPRT